ncbi:MAG TPA: hypothetical protein VHE12_08740 [bacterium]|nr:hypothetical protein [bacterium]
MTAHTTAHTPPGGKKNTRPTLVRQMLSKYVDVLVCGFLGWIICFTIPGWRPYWAQAGLFLFFSQWIWCREQLNPTAGEFFLGIRYLTSSSSQVVADIQVIQAKLKLNGYLILAGIVDLTLAFSFLAGWTFFPNAVAFGYAVDPSLSVAYWTLVGLAFFVCAGYLLGGSRMALFVVPFVHLVLCIDLFLGQSQWASLFQGLPPSFLPTLLKVLPVPVYQLFLAWSFYVVGALGLSHKHMVNP